MITLSELADGARKLSNIAKELSDVEFKEKILELRSLLLDAQETVLASQEKEKALKRRIDELEKTIAFSDTLVEVNGFKYPKNESGEPEGYPYCPKCEIDTGKFYRIFNPGAQWTTSQCPNCKTVFGRAAKLFPRSTD